ncbi:putative hyoscyamine 6-dioxygenase-like [Capsicum annuum]|nr:putative hyoscyamine 6-dioxygenase-like [Capsicum annuum]KAF3680656.1 putative hyoscyamine 6-dioxygenase-like [Capsicum annuum]
MRPKRILGEGVMVNLSPSRKTPSFLSLARRGDGVNDDGKFPVGLRDGGTSWSGPNSHLSIFSEPPRWPMKSGSQLYFNTGLIKAMPLRRTNVNAQDDEVHPTHGIRTHNKAHTSEPIHTPRIPPVLTSPPRAPWTGANSTQPREGEVEGVELATYQLKDVANQWYNEWEDVKGDSAEPTVWDEFVEAFLDRFFPLELREAKVEEFINIKQGKMSVQEYTLKFNQLARYAPELTSSLRD